LAQEVKIQFFDLFPATNMTIAALKIKANPKIIPEAAGCIISASRI
jgi:hypothetical protein